MSGQYEKLLIVTRQTRLQELVQQYNTLGQAKFTIESQGEDFLPYVAEHENYQVALSSIQRQIERLDLKVQWIDRSFLPSIRVQDDEVIVTVGQDGLVANTAKYIGQRPLIALNPDPERFDGSLLPFHYTMLQKCLQKVLLGKESRSPITLGQVTLNDGQKLLAFNDFFVGVKTHMSARYQIVQGGQKENQSSSGIIVSTGAGSTGWLSSLFNMASGMTQAIHGQAGQSFTLPWDDERLVYAVREPFKSKHSGADLLMGMITQNSPLLVHSQMGRGGVIFSDGQESDFLEFNAGKVATIGPAKDKVQMVTP